MSTVGLGTGTEIGQVLVVVVHDVGSRFGLAVRR